MKSLLKKKIKASQLKLICRQIASMNRAGCDYIFIMDEIANIYDGLVRQTMVICKRNLLRGKSLSQSFAMTNQFSNLFLSMVYAGEISGNLDLIFEKLSIYYDREDKVKRAILSASIYPIILILVSIISFNFLMIYVVPNFKMAFSQNQANISTNLLFTISDILREDYLKIIIFFILAVIVIIVEYEVNEQLSQYFSNLKYRLPKVREIFYLSFTDNFSRSLSILLSSGINIEEAMATICNMSDEKYIRAKLQLAKHSILQGNSLSKSLSVTGIFPNLFISMLSIGESTGTIEENLYEISRAYEQALDIELDKFIKIIEPLMILILGLFIGFIIISLMGPMFDLISSIK